jgi:SAM-dependent methyltransferase
MICVDLNSWFNKRLKSLIKRLSQIIIWGSFRRLRPFSNVFGYDRGPQSVARYYVDEFISLHSNDIYGHVLEIGNNVYTKCFGLNLSHSDVLHVDEGYPNVTLVADLTTDVNLPSNYYDCIIMPQTLPFIYDIRAALANTYRILKPNGVLLVTLSGISQISKYDEDRWGDYWRFTTLSATKLFEEFFDSEMIKVQSFGNVLAAVSFLQGLASRELNKNELDFKDPNYQVIITVRAVKK